MKNATPCLFEAMPAGEASCSATAHLLARAPFHTVITERVPNYRAAISAAIVAAWNAKSL
jgi:hypothetical protein